jgi:hypothetical protein
MVDQLLVGELSAVLLALFNRTAFQLTLFNQCLEESADGSFVNRFPAQGTVTVPALLPANEAMIAEDLAALFTLHSIVDETDTDVTLELLSDIVGKV